MGYPSHLNHTLKDRDGVPVPRTPKDRDEVKKREVSECDG
jgi:hypothetical protein